MYTGIEHTAIAAKDTTALSRWYCDTLGFTIAYDNEKAPPTYFIKLGTGLIEIIPASDSPRAARGDADAGWAHLAVSVDDFDAVVKDLGGKGVLLQNVREAGGGVKVGFFKDPEGNLLQIISRPTPL
ncbi:MAG: VOC family protein [Candidatus Latescibacteria bacterium]|jgi:catechol 2,3-dioxygenase-like lactoylglutathione lyase family enzyme|nr:VOC family protein [Candidatus Latescibacterota bacterium]